MLKMGTFGFMRYAMPMFPEATKMAAPWIGSSRSSASSTAR